MAASSGSDGGCLGGASHMQSDIVAGVATAASNWTMIAG